MGIVGPQRKGDSMLGKGVVVRTVVGLMMQETLALLWNLLGSVPLELPLRTCGPAFRI